MNKECEKIVIDVNVHITMPACQGEKSEKETTLMHDAVKIPTSEKVAQDEERSKKSMEEFFKHMTSQKDKSQDILPLLLLSMLRMPK